MKIRPDIPLILCPGFRKRVDADKLKAMWIKAPVLKPILKRGIGEAVRKAMASVVKILVFLGLEQN